MYYKWLKFLARNPKFQKWLSDNRKEWANTLNVVLFIPMIIVGVLYVIFGMVVIPLFRVIIEAIRHVG